MQTLDGKPFVIQCLHLVDLIFENGPHLRVCPFWVTKHNEELNNWVSLSPCREQVASLSWRAPAGLAAPLWPSCLSPGLAAPLAYFSPTGILLPTARGAGAPCVKQLLVLHPLVWGWSWLPSLRLASPEESKLFMVSRACQVAREFTRKPGGTCSQSFESGSEDI